MLRLLLSLTVLLSLATAASVPSAQACYRHEQHSGESR